MEKVGKHCSKALVLQFGLVLESSGKISETTKAQALSYIKEPGPLDSSNPHQFENHCTNR